LADTFAKLSSIFKGFDGHDLPPTISDTFIEGIIGRFEVFDRTALRALFDIPSIVIPFGVGPNAISIPSSSFIDPAANAIYKGEINSVPHILALNYFCWLGMVGIPFLLSSIKRFNALSRSDMTSSQFLVLNLWLCFIITPPTLFLSLSTAASPYMFRSLVKSPAISAKMGQLLT